MSDLTDDIDAVERTTGQGRIPAGDGRTVVLRREYRASVEDVWDAITNADRMTRWFLPVTGELRLGGHYQLAGNAGGDILRCEPPTLLAVTWVYGENPTPGDVSEVAVRLSPTGNDQTLLELEHTAVTDADRWSTYGPGAVGVGWDLALLGLAMHLRGEQIEDKDAWGESEQARQLMTASAHAWGAALAATGATAEAVATATRNTTEFYVPPR